MFDVLLNKFKYYRYKKFVNKKFLYLAGKNAPVFIYQMGKVASSSIYESLKEQYTGIVAHGHWFTPDHYSSEVRFLFDTYKKGRYKIKLISLVREPIGRNFSAFFQEQNFNRLVGEPYKKDQYTDEELLDMFLNLFEHESPEVWFDDNIKRHFQIDVYQHKLKNGYLSVSNSYCDLLLMRHDLEDTEKERHIAQFLELPQFQLKNTNLAQDKAYAAQYKRIKDRGFPEAYVDRTLNYKYSQHFYKEEIADLRKKWRSR